MEFFKSLYKYTKNFFGEEEEQFTIEVIDNGNQLTDDFIKKENVSTSYNNKNNMIFQVGKSKSIMDVKKKIIKNNKKLRNANFNLRSCVFGKVKADTFPLMRMSDKENPDNNVIQLFIQISNCK